MIEQATYPISSPKSIRNRARRSSSFHPSSMSAINSITRDSTSMTNPSDLAFGIELNTPRRATRSKRSQSMVEHQYQYEYKPSISSPSTPKKKKKKKTKRKQNKTPRKKKDRDRSASLSSYVSNDDNDIDPLSSDTVIYHNGLSKLEEEEKADAFETYENDLIDDDQFRHRDDSKWAMKYCADQARRKSSYKIALESGSINEVFFNVKDVCDQNPINLFEIGKIIDVLKGKEHGWSLHEYLSDYCTAGTTSPIFEISHPTKGKHLVFGAYPRLKDSTQFLRYHPILHIIEEFGINKIYTPVKYTKKSGFNYSLQTLITSTSNHRINIENQCEKLFDKILWGKGIWKRIPGVDSVFITHWNCFMRKYRIGVESCYLNGDLKGYILLISMFWAVVLRFKKHNRCKNLSKVLSRRMSYRICRSLDKRLNYQHSSLSLVSLNLLFRQGGIFQTLQQNGWTISPMDEEKILEYRRRNDCGFDDSEVATHVQKVAKHAGKVMSWSRNRGNKESCLIM